VNNRNLKDFKVDLAVTERLASLLPKETLLVAESGIFSRADVERLKACGSRAILVGESLMRSGDIGAAVRQLVGA
jgi:indole-3-glycerol phosphate synthase